jgi:hypothetical protein
MATCPYSRLLGHVAHLQAGDLVSVRYVDARVLHWVLMSGDLVFRLLIARTGRSIGTKRLFNKRQPLCGAVKKIAFSMQLGVCKLDEDCDQTAERNAPKAHKVPSALGSVESGDPMMGS